jgi:hypothetical protein
VHPKVWDEGYLIPLLSQLVIFHHLFYTEIGLTVAVILISLWSNFVRDERRWSARIVSFAVVAGALGSVPLAAVRLARPGPPPWQAIAGASYYALSVFLFLGGSALIARKPQWTARIRWCFVLADFISPALVWAVYRKRSPRQLRGLQFLPLLLTASVVFAPWIVWPIFDPEFNMRLHAAFRPVYRGSPYQIEVDPADGNLVVAGYNSYLYKIDALSGKEISRVLIQPIHDDTQGFGLDQHTREVAYADPCTGHTWFFDEKDLRLKRDTIIRNYQQHRPVNCNFPFTAANRVLWSAGKDILAFFSLSTQSFQILRDAGSLVVYEGNSNDPQFGDLGTTTDAVIEPAFRQLHRISAFPRPSLWRIDVDRGRVGRMVRLPTMPDRVVLDAARRRLFVTLPIFGQVWVFDAASYRRTAVIDSFPGMRAIALDPEQNLLFMGGFSPLLEIRSLDNFALLDRIVGPAWMRWIAADPRRNKVYLSSKCGSAGIWALDLAQLHLDRRGATWPRIDPFYPLMRRLAASLRQLILLLRPDASAFGTLPIPPLREIV